MKLHVHTTQDLVILIEPINIESHLCDFDYHNKYNVLTALQINNLTLTVLVATIDA